MQFGRRTNEAATEPVEQVTVLHFRKLSQSYFREKNGAKKFPKMVILIVKKGVEFCVEEAISGCL